TASMVSAVTCTCWPRQSTYSVITPHARASSTSGALGDVSAQVSQLPLAGRAPVVEELAQQASRNLRSPRWEGTRGTPGPSPGSPGFETGAERPPQPPFGPTEPGEGIEPAESDLQGRRSTN